MLGVNSSAEVVERLSQVVGAENVLTEPAALDPYERDRSPFPTLRPGWVARPGTVDEVAAVVRLANALGLPLLPRGSGYSLAGFPPVADGAALFLDLRRLNRVLEIDEVNMTVTAEAGILAVDLERAVAAAGFDVSTVAVPLRYVTIGGVLSGVSSGGLPRDNGTTGERLMGLKVVLPDGTLVATNAGGSNLHRTAAVMQDGDGPLLTPMFIGDGGSLGVKVEVTLQIDPIARHVEADAWVLDDFDAAWAALLDLARVRETPYTMVGVYEDGGQVVSYVSRASDERLLHIQVDVIEKILERHGGRPAPEATRTAARSMTEAGGDWAEQFLSVERALLAYVLPNRDFPAGFDAINGMLDERFARDGLERIGMSRFTHVSPMTRRSTYVTTSLVFDPAIPEGRAAAAELARDAYALVARLGGYSEPHQGALGPLLAEHWSPAYRDLVHRIKRAVDPNGIVNPGLWADDSSGS